MVDALVELGLYTLKPDALFFTGDEGQRLHYSTFHNRWGRAVKRAKREGLLPVEKSPTPHDLRHSHAAVLLSAGRGLTYVQRRLGHESIKTTSDTYGHLLPQADEDAMDTIEASLGKGPGSAWAAEEALPAQRDERRVFAVHFPGLGHVAGFWDLELAHATAAQWQLDHGEQPRVEAWSPGWWTRSVSGGLNVVHHHMPDRVCVRSVGPAIYESDGTERVVRPEDHEPREACVWEWEKGYTDEPAVPCTEWSSEGHTEASAWGLERDAVVAAYGQARADALRVWRTC